MTSGINLPNSVIVQGGVDGAFFPANQIGWGKSTFAGVEFGSTEGLLNAIETAIGTGGTGAVQELKEYLVSEGYITLTELNTKLNDYATKGFVSDANSVLEAALKAWVNEQKFAAAADLTAHTGDAVAHITDDERTKWNAAKEAIDAFLNDNAVSEGVVDTLKEIQEYITSDGSAADKMTQDIAANKKAIEDEVAAREGAVTTLEGKIADAEAAAKSAATKIVEGSDEGEHLSITSSTDENGATTYTIGLSDVASASALAAEISRASDAEAKALADAKTYADGKASAAESAAKSHADSKAATAESNAKTYADGKAATALADAKTYADGLAGNYDAAGAAATAEQNAKSHADSKAASALTDAKAYADGLAGNYDAAGAAATALTDAKAYADGLAGNYDAAGAAATALTDAKAYADGLAGNYDAAGAAAAAESAAKSHADNKAATAEQNAKDYADAQIAAIPGVDLTPYAYVSTVNDAVKALEDKDAEIVTSYTAADNALAARIKTIEDAPYATESYVTSTVSSEIAKVVAEAPEDFNTLKEIADWIANDVTSAAELANKVTANENAIKAISDDYLKAADKTEIVNAYTAADAALGTRIDNVVTSYAAADTALGTRIDNVVTSYAAADTALGTRIDNVEAAYVTADTALGTRIDNVEAAYVTADNDVKTWVSDNYTTSVNPDANSITVSGTKFTFSFENNVMSVNQYIATALKSVSLSTINATKTNTGGGNKYIGTSYELTAGIDVTTTEQTLTINVTNTTANKYKLAVHDGTSYIINDTDFRTTNGNITHDVSEYIMADVANSTVTGTTTWGTNTHSVNTENEKTFSVWVTEEGKTTLAKKTATQSNINASVTVTGMAPVMKGTDATAATCTTKVTDLVYGAVDGEISLGTHTFGAGEVPTIAVPTCAGKTLKGYNAEGSFQDTSWAIVATAEYTLNGCTTEYAIWCITEDPNADVLVPKANAGEGTLLVKLS
jgi:hypothetical protein